MGIFDRLGSNKGKPEGNNSKFELEKREKLTTVFSFLKELAHDKIFKHDGRKDYHVRGTDPVNLLDNVCRKLMGLTPGRQEEARKEFLKITKEVLAKAESNASDAGEIEKIKKVLDYLNQPEVFSVPAISQKIAEELDVLNYESQINITRHDDFTKDNPSLN